MLSATGSSNTAMLPSPDAALSSQGALLAVIIRSQCASRASATVEIEVSYEHLEALRAEIAQALADARQAEEEAGFWGDIGDFLGEDLATVAGAIAAAAAVVATAGTGAPLVLAVLAAGLEIGSKVGAELGLDPKLSMCLGLAGAALGLLTGNATKLSSLASIASDVQGVATVVQGSAAAGGGVTGAISQEHASDALEWRARVSFGRGQEDDANFDIDEAIRRLEKALRRETRATSLASGVARSEDATNQNVIANIGGQK
jgi:hypothetical protein